MDFFFFLLLYAFDYLLLPDWLLSFRSLSLQSYLF